MRREAAAAVDDADGTVEGAGGGPVTVGEGDTEGEGQSPGVTGAAAVVSGGPPWPPSWGCC